MWWGFDMYVGNYTYNINNTNNLVNICYIHVMYYDYIYELLLTRLLEKLYRISVYYLHQKCITI